ncbi:hypothetical protein BC828DRAFT_400846 [Blastocladiella britannica]|nr:hypothetical protein BC828DRAFT_400846 [Blastocladiella britannica]
MSNVIGNPIATVLPVAAQALDTPASPTTASGTAGPVATATPKPDPCAAGRCKPPGKSQECLLVQKVYSFRSFSNLTYLPVDVRPYFAARFPDLYKADKFPASIQNASDFLNLYGNEPWSLWSQGFESFNLLQAGCAMPRQRWYMTWTLVDIYSVGGFFFAWLSHH